MRLPAFASSGQLVSIFALLAGSAAGTAITVPGQWSNTLLGNACPSTSTAQFFDISGLQCVPCLNNTVPRSDGLGCQCRTGHVLRGLPTPLAISPGLSAGTRAYAVCASCVAFGLSPSQDGTICMQCDTASGAVLSGVTGDCRCTDPGSVVTEFDATGARLSSKRCVACPTAAAGHWQDTFPDRTGTKCLGCPPITSPTDPRVRLPMAATFSGGALTCVCNATADLNCFLSEDVLQSRLPSALPDQQFPSNIIAGAQTFFFYGVTPALSSLQARQALALNTLPPVEGKSPRPSEQQVASAVVGSLALSNAGRCLAYGTREACNALANACVLQMYDTTSVACKLYQGIVNNRNPGEVSVQYHTDTLRGTGVFWTDTMPWLYYRGVSGTDFLARGDVGLKMSFYGRGTGEALTSDLTYILSIYHINGTWAGFRQLTTQFQLCGTIVGSVGNQWRRFGTKFRNSCTLPIAEVLASAGVDGLDAQGNPFFFDLYLQPLNLGSGAATWPQKLYPVPVLNKNVRSAGVLVNADGTASNDVLTRRFFLVDPVSAPTEASTGKPQAVRVASSIALTVKALSDGSGAIFPPLLELTYIDRQPSFGYGSGDTYAFSCDYTMDMGSWRSAWQALLIVSMVVAGMAWLSRLMAISRKRQQKPIDGMTMLRGLLEGCDVFSTGLFVLLTTVSLYWFTFFKLQSDVYTMLPSDRDMRPFWRASIAAVVMSSFGVVGRVYRQVNVDIFILDWGKPRVIVDEYARKREGPVSCWRQLFIANEWNELQTLRVTNVEATYLFAVLFLEGLRIRELTTVQPAHDLFVSDVTQYQTTSILLRFAMVSFFMLAPTLLQWILKKVLIQRLGDHPLGMFVDLLYLANISIFLFDDEYSGYYLHGECGDVNAGDNTLATINELLRREAQNQLQERAMPNAVSIGLRDCLSYEIYVQPQMRDRYQAKLLDLIESQKAGGGGGAGGAAGGTDAADKRMEDAARGVAEDFRKFIQDEAKRAPVRQRDIIETVFHMPPEMSLAGGAGGEQPVIFPDTRFSFGNNLFYGCEWQLIVWNTLVFATVDAAVQSFAVAAFVSWLLNFIITAARAELGEANLSRKSLVDRRFLI